MLDLFCNNISFEAGADEAGRGCLAGPVTCGAVLLDIENKESQFLFDMLNDSKQLSEKSRDELRPLIEKYALSFTVTHVYPDVIDKINILKASIYGMQQSVLKLNHQPNSLIVDGNRFYDLCPMNTDNGIQRFYKEKDHKGDLFLTSTENMIPYTCIVKGDSKYLSIAAASVLAKTYRDEYMNKIHKEFPMYRWDINKGYPTKDHKEAIKEYGLSKYHRMSFKST